MNFDWIDTGNPVAIWWMSLVAVSLLNVALWSFLYRAFRNHTFVHRRLFELKYMLPLCAAYVFGCAFRSFIPRADVQRIVLFDHWISSVAVGRTVATIAEVCFVIQWAILLRYFAKLTKSDTVLNISKVIVPMIVIAEIFSWYAVVTTNYLGNTVENSIWAVVFTLIAVALLRLMNDFRWPVRFPMGFVVSGIVFYVGFLVVVDVPMYFTRWEADMESGKALLGLFSGFHDAATRWTLTHDIAQWREEIAWMGLYFSAAVWSSLMLCGFALIADRMPRYMVRVSRRSGIGAPVPVRVSSAAP
jgi:hypothetical protein